MPLDDQSELFYWVDENDNVLGSVTRGQAHTDPAKIHRAVYILLFNSKNQLLLQKRSLRKDKNPGDWTISVSGHVTYGQSWEQAAKREIKEEIGLTINKLKYLTEYIYPGTNENETEYCRVYQADYNQQPIKIDKYELDLVQWVDISKLPQFIKTHKFTNAGLTVLKNTHLI